MKKVKFDKKLSLNKETVAKLNVEQMSTVKGGEVLDAPVGEARLSWFRCCKTCSGNSMGSYCVAE
jgi:natural product precursor